MSDNPVTLVFTMQGENKTIPTRLIKKCTIALAGETGNALKALLDAPFYSYGPCPKQSNSLRIRITGTRPQHLVHGHILCEPQVTRLGALLAHVTRRRIFLTIEGEVEGRVFKAGD